MKRLTRLAALVASLVFTMAFVNTASADANPFAQADQISTFEAGEGKCGEGKCGDKKDKKKCGEGKCGDKKGKKKCGDKKADKKCGEGKCGGK